MHLRLLRDFSVYQICWPHSICSIRQSGPGTFGFLTLHVLGVRFSFLFYAPYSSIQLCFWWCCSRGVRSLGVLAPIFYCKENGCITASRTWPSGINKIEIVHFHHFILLSRHLPQNKGKNVVIPSSYSSLRFEWRYLPHLHLHYPPRLIITQHTSSCIISTNGNVYTITYHPFFPRR